MKHLGDVILGVVVGDLVELLLQASQVQVLWELSRSSQRALSGSVLAQVPRLTRQYDVCIKLLGGLKSAALMGAQLQLALLHIHQVVLLVMNHGVARVAALHLIWMGEVRVDGVLLAAGVGRGLGGEEVAALFGDDGVSCCMAAVLSGDDACGAA